MRKANEMVKRMNSLIKAIIVGPCKNIKSKLLQRLGIVGWWIYLLYGVYLIKYNPVAALNVLIMYVLALLLPLIIMVIIAFFVKKEIKKEREIELEKSKKEKIHK